MLLGCVKRKGKNWVVASTFPFSLCKRKYTNQMESRYLSVLQSVSLPQSNKGAGCIGGIHQFLALVSFVKNC